MMRFIAMLRDSFKEAVDGWIFLVMLALSGLLILVVASASVRPATVEQAVPEMFDREVMQFISPDHGKASRSAFFLHNFAISNVVPLQAGATPWENEFRFTLTYTGGASAQSGVEVGEAKDMKEMKDLKIEDVKKIDRQSGLFSDPIEDAARYWAAPAGASPKEWPKFTPELAEEFVTFQVRTAAGLDVLKVERKRAPLIAMPGQSAYEVTARSASKLRWPHTPLLFFGAVRLSFLQKPLGSLIYGLESVLVSGLGAWVALLAGIVVTAGFIPNMLRKGAIDLLLTKPMSRPLILVYKYLGGLTFVAVLTAFTAVGIWIAVGLRAGVWAPGLLLAVVAITYYFAILYAFSTLVGVVTRNAIVCIVATLIFWVALFVIGTAHQVVSQLDRVDIAQLNRPKEPEAKPQEKKNGEAAPRANENPPPRAEPPDLRPAKWLVTVTSTLNMLTPRTGDLSTLTSRIIGDGLLSEGEQERQRKEAADVDWPEVIGVSLAYIAIFLGLAVLRFVTRSY